jgi:hypothetical protein
MGLRPSLLSGILGFLIDNGVGAFILVIGVRPVRAKTPRCGSQPLMRADIENPSPEAVGFGQFLSSLITRKRPLGKRCSTISLADPATSSEECFCE